MDRKQNTEFRIQELQEFRSYRIRLGAPLVPRRPSREQCRIGFQPVSDLNLEACLFDSNASPTSRILQILNRQQSAN